MIGATDLARIETWAEPLDVSRALPMTAFIDELPHASIRATVLALTAEIRRIQQERLEELAALRKAWEDEGNHPDFHRDMADRLRSGWPTLGKAVEDLLESTAGAQ